MASQATLNSTASEAIKLAVASVRESSIELSETQVELVKEYKESVKALALAKAKNEDGRANAHKAVDSEFNDFRKKMDLGKKELAKSFKAELIKSGIKDPDMVLADTAVIKVADTVAKKGFGLLGKVKGYIGNAIERGEESLA